MIEIVTVDKYVGAPYEQGTSGFVIVDNKLYISAAAASDLTDAVSQLLEWMQYPNRHMGEAARDLISRTLLDKVARETAQVSGSIRKGSEALESKLFDDSEAVEEAS